LTVVASKVQYKFEEDDDDDDEEDIVGGGGDGVDNKRESSSDDGGRDSDFNPAGSDDDDDEYSQPAAARFASDSFISVVCFYVHEIFRAYCFTAVDINLSLLSTLYPTMMRILKTSYVRNWVLIYICMLSLLLK